MARINVYSCFFLFLEIIGEEQKMSATATITLTPKQAEAVRLAKQWYKGSEQVMAIVGYAGTGKSFLVDYIISDLGISYDEVAFVAYTGKAALVLTQKSNGKYQATTIHKLIYELDDSQKTPQFVLRDKASLTQKYKLIVVDEASMVDRKIEEDLKSFGIKILAIGDQGQLEPVSSGKGDNKGTLLENPAVVLTEIHRQAEGNPIIHLSMLARQRKRIEPGKYGDKAYVLRKQDLDPRRLLSIYMRADQVLCGYNNTRKRINQDIRRALGFTSPLPQVSDKVICTKNNWSKSINGIALVNGMTGFVQELQENVKKDNFIRRDCMKIAFRPDFMKESFKDVLLLHDEFKNNKVELSREEYSIYDQFDFGYVITTHKSQGSQWNNVVLINEVLNSESHHRWLYTGITRAADKLILIV
jgi:exodeoxyribonuclease V